MHKSFHGNCATLPGTEQLVNYVCSGNCSLLTGGLVNEISVLGDMLLEKALKFKML